MSYLGRFKKTISYLYFYSESQSNACISFGLEIKTILHFVVSHCDHSDYFVYFLDQKKMYAKATTKIIWGIRTFKDLQFRYHPYTTGCTISLRTVGVATKPVQPRPLSFAGFFNYVHIKKVCSKFESNVIIRNFSILQRI